MFWKILVDKYVISRSSVCWEILDVCVLCPRRGQESAGIVVGDGTGKFNTHKGMGLVSQVFKDDFAMSQLNKGGKLGIGLYTAKYLSWFWNS